MNGVCSSESIKQKLFHTHTWAAQFGPLNAVRRINNCSRVKEFRSFTVTVADYYHCFGNLVSFTRIHNFFNIGSFWLSSCLEKLV